MLIEYFKSLLDQFLKLELIKNNFFINLQSFNFNKFRSYLGYSDMEYFCQYDIENQNDLNDKLEDLLREVELSQNNDNNTKII